MLASICLPSALAYTIRLLFPLQLMSIILSFRVNMYLKPRKVTVNDL